MARSACALLLLAAPAVAVRIADPSVADEAFADTLSHAAPSTASSLAAQRQELIPGIDSTPECCCYQTPCTWHDEQEYDAKPMYMNISRFEKGKTGMVDACCKNYSTIQIFACSGQTKMGFMDCLYTPFAQSASTVDSCADKLAWFFAREDWWHYLSDYDQHSGWFGSSTKRAYQKYVPCLNSKRSHTQDVVLSKLSYFKTKTWGNPVRLYAQSRHECKELSQEQLQYAVEKSYDKLCKFPMKHSYRPNFQPQQACTYNKTSSLIYMNPETTCPEGHRCACPVNGKTLPANPEKKGILHKLVSGETYVKALAGIANIGILAGLGVAAGWTLPVTAPGAVLLVYGGGAAVSKLTASCENNVGCFPMDCAYEENVGCRINLHADEGDPRNPYWFLPPPMYKCSANRWGKCQLSACSSADLRQQRVREGTGTYGIWRRKPISIVQNCQPLLARDMNKQEIKDFESLVGNLRSKEHEAQRRMSILKVELQHLCPFLSSSEYSRSARCQDGFTCEVVGVDDPSKNCCVSHGGVKQCPAKYPALCMDGFCDHAIGRCNGRGGPQTCPAENECKFLIPTAEDDVVECNDGSLLPTSQFTGALCAGHAGLQRCPWNKPTMCQQQTNGEHVCAKDCSELGGPFKCEGLQQERGTDDKLLGARSGAPRSVQSLLQTLAAVLAAALALH